MRASLLYYDIPDSIRFPNPSRLLRRVAVRVNLSVWVVPVDLIPWNLLARMDAKGISRNVVEFADKEADNLIAIARAAFAAQVIAAANSAQKTASKAAGVGEDEGLEGADLAHYVDARVRAATRKGERLIAELTSAASGFGLSPDDFAAPNALSQLAIIRSVSASRAAKYAKATRKVRALASGSPYSTAAGLANAAESDTLPAFVLADFLRDSGDDDGADELQESFSE